LNEAQILAEELSSDSVGDRRRAAKMLAMLEEQSAPACLTLLHAVADPDEQVREWVYEAIENFGPPPTADRESICNLACSAEADTRFLALKVLARLREQASDTASELVKRSSVEAEPIVLTQMLKTLAKISPADDQEVNGCLKMHCSHADERVKAAAERLLAGRK